LANALLAYQNRVDSSTIVGGSWATALPLLNLKDRLLSKVARSTNTATASTQFTVTLSKGFTIHVMALCRHNLSSGATWRIRAFSDAGFTTQVYDSGTEQVWGAAQDSLQLEWQDDNFWSGRFEDEDLQGYYWNAIHILDVPTYSRYWKIELVDTTNTSGYLEIGRLFMSEAWTPTINMSWGASIGYNHRTQIEEAWDGTEFFDVRPPYRTAQFQLANMKTSEAMTRAFDMQRLAGVDKEVLFIYDKEDVQHLIRRAFLGRVRELSPIEQPYFEAHQTSYTVKELL